VLGTASSVGVLRVWGAVVMACLLVFGTFLFKRG
jgi:hypothetical protein